MNAKLRFVTPFPYACLFIQLIPVSCLLMFTITWQHAISKYWRGMVGSNVSEVILYHEFISLIHYL